MYRQVLYSCLVSTLLAGSVVLAETPAGGDDGPLWRIDSDGDGVANLAESLHGTDGFDAADYPEISARDQDGDLVPDATELLHGSDPLDAAKIPAAIPTDTDADGVFDVLEILDGTDPLNAADHRRYEVAAPTSDGEALQTKTGFPTTACRTGFVAAEPSGINHLCIESLASSRSRYGDAAALCRDRLARVCTYEDLHFTYLFGNNDAAFNPMGMWIGNVVGDDSVLCGNRNITSETDGDRTNFEGTCNKNSGTARTFRCCHDLL